MLNAEKRANQATHTLTSSQLDELFQNCIKLSTENKINVKNTWSLNLIDYIDEVITSSKLGENEVSNFQVASCTLDASVKT
ncbi:Condensin complex subunit 2 [compost metagenome]